MNATRFDTLTRRKPGPKPQAKVDELPPVKVDALKLWSVRECSEILAVSRERVKAAIDAGDLPAEPAGGHSRRVLAIDAVRVLANHLMPRLQFK